MRITVRLIFALFVGVTLVSFLFARHQVHAQKEALRGEVEARAGLLANSIDDEFAPLLERREWRELQLTAERIANREELAGIAVYDEHARVVAITAGLAGLLPKRPTTVDLAMAQDKGIGEFVNLGQTPMHIYAQPLRRGAFIEGALVIVNDASSIEAKTADLWRNTFLSVMVQMLFIAIVTLLIVRWSVEGPVVRTVEWMRRLRDGNIPEQPPLPDGDLFKPLTREVAHFAWSLSHARAAAEEEARLREAAETIWTPERLRVHVKGRLEGNPLFVVSNREPIEHVRRGKAKETVVPASGLVTALEPILRACDGTWIAQGSGDGDREAVDDHDRLRVPPDDPQYTLRRVWLTEEEVQGYYNGFANEGLWPLCHIAHTRPVFRAEDLLRYREVNQKFAAATLGEMKGTEDPFVLVQDYHFALLSRLIKRQRPDARVAIFWHIPWPNAQVFGICPYQAELLDGLLGADLVGFQTQSHCNAFLETVDNSLESRIDWERFAVNRNGHTTLVRRFPISVAVPESVEKPQDWGAAPNHQSPYLQRADLLKNLGVKARFMGVGVDRVDYTKGLIERFRGIECFLDKHPTYQKQFSFVQIGAPSRSGIPRYHELMTEVEKEVDRINARFPALDWKPIVFLKKHHSHQEIEPYYKCADLCMVTSLHDGMNLVAKEFVAARVDEQGELILSGFTGAASELRDALIVNPYDVEQLAEAIRYALEMDSEERKSRMQRMRRTVKEKNIYRWAGNLIEELSQVRLDHPVTLLHS